MRGVDGHRDQRRLPQRALLLAVVGSFVLVVAAMWMGSTYIDRELTLNRAERNAGTLSRLLEKHAEATLDAASLMLAYLAHALVEGADPSALHGLLTNWAAVRDFTASMPQLGTVWVLGPDGRHLFSSAPTPSFPDGSPELSYFATPGAAADGVLIGRLRESPQGAFFTISKGVPMPDGTGVVMATISSAPFIEFYRSIDLPTRSFVALMHRDGALMATPWPSRLADRGVAAAAIVSAPEGLRWAEMNNATYVLAWRQLRYGELVVLAALAKSDVLENWNASLQRNGLMGVAAAVILAGITAMALASLRREEQSRANLDRVLREKEMLFKELHHRVKNNLQVITSLITMQALRFPQPELQESFRQTMNRVRAMGLVHELLYQQERSERLDFGEYLTALLTTLAESHGATARGIRVSCEADGRELDLNTAIPAALIINELMTNALKYAFPDGRSGHIHVGFKREDGRCTLTIADDGVGSAPADAAQGTGLGRLIVKNLAAQLSADYSVDTSAGHGTRVSLSFPC